jgi:hypothetical protein
MQDEAGDAEAQAGTVSMCNAILRRADRAYERLISSPSYREEAADQHYVLSRQQSQFCLASMKGDEAQMQQALDCMAQLSACEPQMLWSLAVTVKGV